MEDDFALRYARIYPGVNSRAELVTLPVGSRIGYLHPGKCEHSEVQSHPPLCNGWSTLDGFRRYAHARVITDFKNMTDYHEERTLKACEKSKTKTRTTATRLQETLEKR